MLVVPLAVWVATSSVPDRIVEPTGSRSRCDASLTAIALAHENCQDLPFSLREFLVLPVRDRHALFAITSSSLNKSKVCYLSKFNIDF
ncbi:hypothetical protein [Paraburkholderia pallida]|uniref:Uncharacterized protein n=1 Tax=Paraburkholderia pallida TaxID=2547399 RepID=A0A4P7CWJ5_9BURK|nr:hypothetical protein [Paraburkholderia pallida]QBR00576.1 hypothetical protein E1956_26465 [Paraburkholderia pallida]